VINRQVSRRCLPEKSCPVKFARSLRKSCPNTRMTVETGGPTESAKMIDWMWFLTLPVASWAVGGHFDDTYVKGRKMALARIIAPQGLMNTELKSRAVKKVSRVLKASLGVGKEEDDTGSAETTQNEIARLLHQKHGKGETHDPYERLDEATHNCSLGRG